MRHYGNQVRGFNFKTLFFPQCANRPVKNRRLDGRAIKSNSPHYNGMEQKSWGFYLFHTCKDPFHPPGTSSSFYRGRLQPRLFHNCICPFSSAEHCERCDASSQRKLRVNNRSTTVGFPLPPAPSAGQLFCSEDSRRASQRGVEQKRQVHSSPAGVQKMMHWQLADVGQFYRPIW